MTKPERIVKVLGEKRKRCSGSVYDNVDNQRYPFQALHISHDLRLLASSNTGCNAVAANNSDTRINEHRIKARMETCRRWIWAFAAKVAA